MPELCTVCSAGFRGEPKGPGSRAPHQTGAPTMFMYLAICTTCACHLVIFISEESLYVLLNCIDRPDGSISLAYYLIL